MSLVAAVKGLGQSETLGLAASLFIFLSWSHLFLSPLFASHTDTHTHLLSFSLLTSLHYREDGEDHLQFSNLYDSALFNKRPLFPM